MSNERFTQGEWCVSIEQITPTSNKTSYAVYTISFDVVSPMLGIRNVFDAQLIAAAPDMYRALQGFVSNSSVQTNFPHECEVAEAALAKADGEV